MIRTLLALAVFAAVPATAAAQAAPETAAPFRGVTVNPPADKDSYVIRLNVTGVGAKQMREMIWQASNDACDHVSRVNDMNPAYTPLCVERTNVDGLRQMRGILRQREHGGQPVQIAIAPHFAMR